MSELSKSEYHILLYLYEFNQTLTKHELLERMPSLNGFESIPRTRFVRIFSRFQRVSISSFRPAVKPKPFDR